MLLLVVLWVAWMIYESEASRPPPPPSAPPYDDDEVE